MSAGDRVSAIQFVFVTSLVALAIAGRFASFEGAERRGPDGWELRDGWGIMLMLA